MLKEFRDACHSWPSPVSKDPIIVKARGEGDTYVIYMRPSYAEAVKLMEDTMGKTYDRIERQMITGGIPTPMLRFEVPFVSRRQALGSISQLDMSKLRVPTEVAPART